MKQRAAKDRSDREKQIASAKDVNAPTEKLRRYRFIKATGQTVSFNVDLIAKAEKLEGIKEYITNTRLSELAVIERYHDLWHVADWILLTKK